VRHIALTEEGMEILKGTDHSKDRGVDGRMTLERILGK